MSWLSRISQKAMPLPFDMDYIEHHYNDGAFDIDDMMNEDTANQLRQDYNPEYLGSGSEGIALQDPGRPNVVMKITNIPSEAKVAEIQKNMGYPFLVDIYKVTQIQSETDANLWSIEMEKVQTLTDKQKNLYDDFSGYVYKITDPYDAVHEFLNFIKRYSDFDTNIQDKYGFSFDNNQSVAEASAMLVKIHEFYRQLLNSPVSSDDSHSDNVGFNSKGALVLFDFGMSNIK